MGATGSTTLRRFSYALLIGAAVPLAAMQGAGAVTLQEAVRIAVTTNPEVLELGANRRAVDNELQQAKAGYRPQVDLRGATGAEWTDRPATRYRAARVTFGEDPDTWQWRTESSITLRQMIFDGFATDSEVGRQEARVDSAANRVGDSSQVIGLNAVLAYLQVLRWGELVKIAEANTATHAQTLKDVGRRTQAGQGNLGDVRQAEARVAAAKVSQVRFQGGLRDAEANYLRVVGDTPSGLERPPEPREALPANTEAAVDLALGNSPRISVAMSDIETSKAERKATDAPFWPRLDLELTHQRNKNIDGTRGHDRDFTAMLVARYNLYAGGADTAERKEFIERAVEAGLRLDRVKREVAEETRLSWNEMMTERGRTAELGAQVTANEGVVEAYRQQFLIGQRGLLDLLDSQNELFVSRGDRITAKYTALFGAYRVLAATGTLLDALQVTPAGESMPMMQKKAAADAKPPAKSVAAAEK